VITADRSKEEETYYSGEPLALHTPSIARSVPEKKLVSEFMFWAKFKKSRIPSQTHPATSGMNQYERPNILLRVRRRKSEDAQSISALFVYALVEGGDKIRGA
jgi:hypothetical protein